MFKRMMSCALFVGLMAVSVTSNATLLVNHHNEPYREYKRHVTDPRTYPKAVKKQRQNHPQYVQRAKVVDRCLRVKDGKNYRVC